MLWCRWKRHWTMKIHRSSSLRPRWTSSRYSREMPSLSKAKKGKRHWLSLWSITNLKMAKSEWIRPSEKIWESDLGMLFKFGLLGRFPTWPKFMFFLLKTQLKEFLVIWPKPSLFPILRMHTGQSKKEIYLLFEVISSLSNSKLWRLNPKIMGSLLPTLCFIPKESQLTEKINKNLMKLGMMILEAVASKWLWFEKWLSFLSDTRSYSKPWEWNLLEVFFSMVLQDQERLSSPEQSLIKQEHFSFWSMVLRSCQRWPVKQKEI